MDQLSFSNDALIKKGQEGIDGKGIAKKITAVGLIAALIWAFATYVLPFLVNLVWDTTKLAIGIGVLGAVIFVLAHIWKRLPLINELVAKYTLGLIIEFDEFVLQETQIKEAEKDVEKVIDEVAKIEGKYAELNQKVEENVSEYEVNAQAAQEAQRKQDMERAEDFMLAAQRNQSYVQAIQPITQDLKFIIDFTKEIQKVLKRKINNAKLDLEKSKDIFKSAQTGERMLLSAKKAMTGDAQLNADAMVAKKRVQEKIALSIGQMRTSMAILSDISRTENYKDKAKLEIAKRNLQELNQSTGGNVTILQAQPASKTFKGVEPVMKFKDLL